MTIRSNWWTQRWVFPAATLAAGAPLLWPQVPPLADLPGHMASYYVSIALAHSAVLQRFYGFEWHLIGNLGVDLLVIPLGHLLGVELATKLVVIAIPMLTALALLLLARQAHGQLPATALAAVPLVYNDPFIFGFVNYSLAAAFALLGLLWWQRWPSDRRRVLRATTFAAVAITIWLMHAIGWIMFVAICAAAQFQASRASHASPARALRATIIACLPLTLPAILMALSPHADRTIIGLWLSYSDLALAVGEVLRDRWIGWDIASTLFLLALAFAGLVGFARLRPTPSLVWPATALFVLFILLPMLINGSDYFNTRLFCYSFALFLISIDTNGLTIKRQRIVALAVTSFVLLRLAGNTVSFWLYDASYDRELSALDKMSPGARILSLVELPCFSSRPNWTKHRLEHLPAIAVIRKDAFVNDLWTIKRIHLLQDRMPQAAPFRHDPSQLTSEGGCIGYPAPAKAVAAAPLAKFDYVWLVGTPPAERPNEPRLVPIWATPGSVLYRVNPKWSTGRQK